MCVHWRQLKYTNRQYCCLYLPHEMFSGRKAIKQTKCNLRLEIFVYKVAKLYSYVDTQKCNVLCGFT